MSMHTMAPTANSLRSELRSTQLKPWEILMISIWGLIVIGGMFLISSFGFVPGPSNDAPVSWPNGTSLTRHHNRASLLLFAHPRCPCTSASLDQLRRIIAETRASFDCYVVFLTLASIGEDWRSNAVIRAAEEIPGVKVLRDDGTETHRFAALTSGHVLLYDENGRLSYSGGITISRGHRGDNSGSQAVTQLLNQKPTNIHQLPTFGCPLFKDLPNCRNAATCQP